MRGLDAITVGPPTSTEPRAAGPASTSVCAQGPGRLALSRLR